MLVIFCSETALPSRASYGACHVGIRERLRGHRTQLAPWKSAAAWPPLSPRHTRREEQSRCLGNFPLNLESGAHCRPCLSRASFQPQPLDLIITCSSSSRRSSLCRSSQTQLALGFVWPVLLGALVSAALVCAA